MTTKKCDEGGTGRSEAARYQRMVGQLSNSGTRALDLVVELVELLADRSRIRRG